MNEYEYISLIFQALGAMGVLAAVATLLFWRRDYNQDKHDTLFEGSHREYLDFIRLCMDYPELDTYAESRGKSENLSDEVAYKRDLAYCYLIATLERAYFLNKKFKTSANITNSTEWTSYIARYAGRQSFLETWGRVRDFHDRDFSKWLGRMLSELERTQSETKSANKSAVTTEGADAPPA